MGRYWDKRSIELENLEQEKTDTDIMKVNKLFDEAIVYLQKEIEKIFDKYSGDSGLPETAAWELLNVKQTEEVRQALMNALAQCEDQTAKRVILGKLNAPAYAARIARLEALRDLVYAQAYKVGSEVSATLERRLVDVVSDSYYRTVYDMQKNTTYAYDFNKLADNDVKAAIAQNWAGGNYSSRIWKNTEKLAQNLENVIVEGLMTGQSIRTMSERLEKKAEGDKYSINRLMRTEVNYCCNQGALMSLKDAGMEKYIFLATLDLRTSEICQSLDKKVFYVKDAKVGKNYPPMHPHCRSTATAYIEGRDTSRLKRRARDPETGKTVLVPYDMNYEEWYERYVAGRGEKTEGSIVKNGSAGIMKMDLQFFSRNSKDYSTVFLSKDEYAHVMSELNTHLSGEQRNRKVITKAIGNYVYTVENNGFGNYRIIGKNPIDENIDEWWDN